MQSELQVRTRWLLLVIGGAYGWAENGLWVVGQFASRCVASQGGRMKSTEDF